MIQVARFRSLGSFDALAAHNVDPRPEESSANLAQKEAAKPGGLECQFYCAIEPEDVSMYVA
jgi:hypothetical protein